MAGQIVADVFHSNYGDFTHQNLAAVHSRKHCAKVTFSVYPHYLLDAPHIAHVHMYNQPQSVTEESLNSL